jgi:hypothetical protein
VTGADKSFTAAKGPALQVAMNGTGAGTGTGGMVKLSHAHWQAIVAKIANALAGKNVTVSKGGSSDNIELVDSYFNESRTIDIEFNGITAAAVTLTSGETTTQDFTWKTDYQQYTGHPRSLPTITATSSGTAFQGAAADYPTLVLRFISDVEIEASADDMEAFADAVRAAVDGLNLNILAGDPVRGGNVIPPKGNNGPNGKYEADPNKDITNVEINIPALGGAGGSDARLTMQAGSNAAGLDVGSASDPYADPAALGAFSLPQEVKEALENANSITVNFASSGPADVSLAYVHYLREAISAAKPGIAIAVNVPSGITPVFSSKEWLTLNISGDAAVKDLYATYLSASTYTNFDSDGIEILNGIKVFKHPSDNKPMIAYNRDIKVSDVALDANNGFGMQYQFHGLGLKKETSGNISPIGDNPISIHGGKDDYSSDCYDSTISSFSDYEALLKEAGLYPAGTMLADHSKISITTAGSNGANVMSNGIYDFILAYHNPKAGGTFADGTDLKARLPQWPASGLTLDGSATPAGYGSTVPYRKIFDNQGTEQTLSNGNRKASDGRPNLNFAGSLTVPMANYLISDAHVTEFRNTNIIGDRDKWLTGNGAIPIMHVGLIGDHSTSVIGSSYDGEIDIVGALPVSIGQGTRKGFLHVWNDISSSLLISGFRVVRVHGSNGHLIYTGDVSDPTAAIELIIFDKKYSNMPDNILKPHHRAFVDANGNIKLTGSGSDFDAKYLGQDSTKPVPKFDANSWQAINTQNGDPGNLANNYSSLDASYKWSNQAALDSGTVSAASANSPAHLVAGARQSPEAVLPAKKKPRFEEA